MITLKQKAVFLPSYDTDGVHFSMHLQALYQNICRPPKGLLTFIIASS